jgi:hypothetical protein
LLARNLGLRTAVLTSCSEALPVRELLPGIEVKRVSASDSTRIRNIYTERGREQWMPARAGVLGADDVPPEWLATPVVLLGPVAGELDPHLARAFGPRPLVGLGMQGLLREASAGGRVRAAYPLSPESSSVLERADALFLSDEDIPADDAEAALVDWSARTAVVAFTRGYNGAEVASRGEWRHIGAFPAHAVDPTGAGDVFAAAFLVRYHQAGDPWDAARFASCAASLVVEKVGVEGVPGREAIEARLAQYPEVVAV